MPLPFSPASSRLHGACRCGAALLLSAAVLALAACDPRPADKPLSPTAPPVPKPSAVAAPAG